MGSLSSWTPPLAHLRDCSHIWTLPQANQLGMGGRPLPSPVADLLIFEGAAEGFLGWARCGGDLTPPISSDTHRQC